MGADLHWGIQDAMRERSDRFVSLKLRLCDLLNLKCEFDRDGPGGESGATDDEVIAAVTLLVELTKWP